MPLTPPTIDDRRYQQLLEDALDRVAVHTPEWTNFNNSDPGVTLVQLFAFLTENLLYRANLSPERNRIKFLQLLRMPLATATAARGLVTFNNERGLLATETLPAGLEVSAGKVAFRTELGLDVLPVETRVFFKRPLNPAPPDLVEYYRLLYASYQQQMPLELNLYSTVALDSSVVDQVDLNIDTVDRSLWIAMIARKNDVRGSDPNDPWKPVRDSMGGRTLTLGLAPALDADQARLVPGGQARSNDLLVFELPGIAGDGKVPRDSRDRPAPGYRQLEPRTEVDLLTMPGVVQLTLPDASDLGLWRDLDPLEAGVVTVMAIPRFDPAQPDAPLADKLFLNSLCRYLEPRRLVTTELVVCGPVYKSIWISIGIDVAAGFAVAEVVEAVKQRLRQFLAPIAPYRNGRGYAAQSGLLFGLQADVVARGWPLRMAVSARVLLAETARVSGVTSVFDDVLLAEATGADKPVIEMMGLELPRVLGISVVAGEPLPIAAVRGDAFGTSATGGTAATPPTLLPVPIIPESC